MVGFLFCWTTRRIQAAKKLVEDELSHVEGMQVIRDNLEELVKPSPHGDVASRRIQTVIDKWSPSAISTLQKTLVTVVNQTVMKSISPR